MAGVSSGSGGRVLTSKWDGLSEHLIARFYPVRHVVGASGKVVRWERIPDSFEVHAPITDAAIESTQNWHSQFENTGADQQFSSISALLQSGALAGVAEQFSAFVQNTLGSGVASNAAQAASDATRDLTGRSSVTKLNSTQTFQGMPPMRVSLTAHFRAISDARAEVERPLNQLMSWSLPQELAQDGPVLTIAGGNTPSLYPSRVPQVIGMQYADMLLLPLVIETQPYPLSGPRTSGGTLASAQVAMQLATLTALDARDWAAATPYRGSR